MRYPDSGGLSSAARAKREELRLHAAELFEAGLESKAIAEQLRVTRKSVNEWRRVWREGGVEALLSKGPGGYRCRLDQDQIAILEFELDRGPAWHGWDEDQRWTLARVVTLTLELFGIEYTLRGMSYLLHRLGWTPQVPAHRAAERDEETIATWVREAWPDIKVLPSRPEPGSASSTSPASHCGRRRPAPGPAAATPLS